MTTMVHVGVASGAVTSILSISGNLSAENWPAPDGEVSIIWSWPGIDPARFNESHWFDVQPSGPGGWTLGLNTYTPAQKAAKAAVPDYPAVWSNVTMSWQDQRTLQQAKDDKWAAFKAARELMLQAPLEWGGMTFDADLASQARIQGAVLNELLLERASTISPGVEWTLADNTETHLDAADVFDIATQLAARTAMIFGLFRSARTAIYACSSHAELDAIEAPELP